MKSDRKEEFELREENKKEDNNSETAEELGKGIKDLSASNVRKVTFQGSPYNAYKL